METRNTKQRSCPVYDGRPAWQTILGLLVGALFAFGATRLVGRLIFKRQIRGGEASNLALLWIFASNIAVIAAFAILETIFESTTGRGHNPPAKQALPLAIVLALFANYVAVCISLEGSKQQRITMAALLTGIFALCALAAVMSSERAGH